MSDQPNVTNVVKTQTSPFVKGFYFLLGCVASGVIAWAVPSSCDVAINTVGNVVEKTPGVVDSVGTTVGGWLDKIGGE